MTKIFYKKSNKTRYYSIKIQNNNIFVNIPRFGSRFIAEKFVQNKKEWIKKNLNKGKNKKINLSNKTNEDYKNNKVKVFEEIINIIKELNLDFNYNKIYIKNQKTIWGSCSSKNNLNFNYKLIYLPDYIKKYLVVHELCHLRQMNHSKLFWKEVEKIIPDYRKTRKDLKNMIQL